jgi:hypothetical protein
MDRQKLKRLITDHLVSTVRHLTHIDARGPSLPQFLFLLVGFYHTSFEHLYGFFSFVHVPRYHRPWWYLYNRNNDLHVFTAQVGLFELRALGLLSDSPAC